MLRSDEEVIKIVPATPSTKFVQAISNHPYTIPRLYWVVGASSLDEQVAFAFVACWRVRVFVMYSLRSQPNMSELSAYVGAEYEGALDFNGKWTGQGKLKYADGIVYNGGFEDGSVRNSKRRLRQRNSLVRATVAHQVNLGSQFSATAVSRRRSAHICKRCSVQGGMGARRGGAW